MNKLNNARYFLMHIWCIFIFHILYNNFLFECVNGMDYYDSRKIYWMIIVNSTWICYLLTSEKRHTKIDVFMNVILSFGIYSLISLSSMFKTFTTIFFVILSILIVYLGYCIFKQKISRGYSRRQIIRKRICIWFYASKVISSFLIAVTVSGMMVSISLNDNLVLSKVKSSTTTEDMSEWTIDNKIEEVSNFDENRWKQLSIQEKTNHLQISANIISRYLGIEPPKVGSSPLEEGVLGQYMHHTNVIKIDIEHLKNSSAHKVLNTLAHETRHSFQKQCVDMLANIPVRYHELLPINEIWSYKKGFDTYGDDSPEGYAKNRIEIDAREFADWAVSEFYGQIEKYNNKKQGTCKN